MTQKSKAALLRKLHHGPRILVLPNAWDAASAAVFETAGFPAIATTSGGVANSLGYPDGENVPRDEMVGAIRRIACSVAIPVTADIEAGYGRKPKDVAATVKAVIAAGAVGINLEDGTKDARKPLREIEEQVERIRAAREAARRSGVAIVINARIDTYLRQVGDESERLDHTARRARAYFEAGADGVFPIGFYDETTIAALARAIDGPVNVIVGPATPTISRLQELGVARVSFGSAPMRAAMGTARRFATELLSQGTCASLFEAQIGGGELNKMMSRRR
jgi:2-methylisocitrate lyase-like PEP mutase family enzyme